MTKKLLVIADDLSGATDVGVQFAKQGISAVVWRWEGLTNLRKEQLASLLQAFQVILVDTESRHLAPKMAAAKVRAVHDRFQGLGITHWFKKTDSTLRGNVGAELEGFMLSLSINTLPFIPAHPLLGRKTRHGVHYVENALLEHSTFAHDPRSPMKESEIATILGHQTSVPVRSTNATQSDDFSNSKPEGILLFDIETEKELIETVARLAENDLLKAVAGSAGFANCLPESIGMVRTPSEIPQIRSPLLVINGSLNENSFLQCQTAIAQGFLYYHLSPSELFSPAPNQVDQIFESLSSRRNVLLSTAINSSELQEFRAASLRMGYQDVALPERVAEGIGCFSKHLFSALANDRIQSSDEPQTLVIIGGDTLGAVAEANQWPGFIARDEILPGAALCAIVNHPNFLLITKPGGFGDANLLVDLASKATFGSPK